MWGLTADDTIRITKHSTLIDIETVDRASSLDKELIIVSPVRSNKHVKLKKKLAFFIHS